MPPPTPTSTSTHSYHALTTPLTHELGLLHLVFHRNRNQHHSSKWWKHLSILKRTLHKLTQKLSSLPPPAHSDSTTANNSHTSLTKTARKKLKKEAASALTGGNGAAASEAEKKVGVWIDAYLRHLRRVVIPSCYIAFTSVIATTQFSALGIILLAILGRIHKTIGPGTPEEEAEDRRISTPSSSAINPPRRRTLSDDLDGDEDGGDGVDGIVISRDRSELVLMNEEDDHEEGVAVDRQRTIDDHDHDEGNDIGDVINSPPSPPPPPQPTLQNTAPIPPPSPEIDFFAPTPSAAVTPVPSATKSTLKPTKTKTKMKTTTSMSTSTSTTATSSQTTTKRKAKKSDDALSIPSSSSSSSHLVGIVGIDPPPPPKKKKKSKKNAIDDLFAGLL
ncbi:hypothetical protein DFH27DRAFT_390375 [Peziza echinospora]|nr:hypothetical protein DFH27DRAFT_390375 [Peziza echinospora]